MVFGIANGIMFGYAAALLSTRGAGFVCFQHLILRILLWRSGCIPWNYARFLDYAEERIFLRKVGGGYIFVHRILLEHFAHRESRWATPRQADDSLEQVKTKYSSGNMSHTVAKPTHNLLVCRNCDRLNPTDGKFCIQCGKKLSDHLA